MRFIIACGGTAGHVNPALAVADEIRARAPEAGILFIGAGKRLENILIPQAGYEIRNIKMSGLERGVSPEKIYKNIKTAMNLISAGREAGARLREYRPDAVIGTGGYICYPVLKQAAGMGIPAYIHESNAVPGLTTKLLSAAVDNVFTAFPGLEGQYRRPERAIFTGTPVRKEFRETAGGAAPSGMRGKRLVVSFWGSLGAEVMNEKMAVFIKMNIEEGRFDHIHATGKPGGVAKLTERLALSGALESLAPGIQIREYIDDMPSVMRNADIVLCRAGGSTIGELIALAKPSVLIPSLYTTNNQQPKNAEQLRKAGGALVLAEKDCTGESLYHTVLSLLDDTARLKSMSDALNTLSGRGAESQIVDILLKRQ